MITKAVYRNNGSGYVEPGRQNHIWVVDVSGVFDHPAAANCTITEMDGEPVESQRCRLAFAVEKLAPRR